MESSPDHRPLMWIVSSLLTSSFILDVMFSVILLRYQPYHISPQNLQVSSHLTCSTKVKHFLWWWLYWGLNSGLLTCLAGALPLELVHQPCFVLGIFWDRVSWNISPDWFRTVILLISASQGARIIGVCQQHLDKKSTFNVWQPHTICLLQTFWT
jgi:hypothetical protein